MKKVLEVLTDKFFLASVGFMAWVGFFDQNDWMTMQQRQRELNGIKDNIAYLNSEISRMEAEKNALTVSVEGSLNNPAELEKYAREHYRMKHDGEDVYVIDK